MKSRLLIVITLVGVVAVLAFAQTTLAAENPHHYTIKMVPRQHQEQGAVEPAALAANLYGLAQYFGATPYVDAAVSPTNSDGYDLWPCFGSYTSSGGTSSENTDCPTIGNPSQPFPVNAIAIGGPAYVWSLSACNATSTSANYCGQTQTWYEDDTNDSTDEEIYSIVATQGTTIIADSGTVVFGPNTFGGLTPPADVIIYGDQNFGNMGETGGANNGNCSPDYDYPLATNAWPGSTYVIAAGKTCGAAVSGPVSITATTEVAKVSYTKGTTAALCTPIVNGAPGTPVGPPCYLAHFTSKYKVLQKWTILLQ